MNASITFRTDSSLKALIEENAAKSHTSVSAYLTELIKQVFAHDKSSKQLRDVPLSDDINQYMGMIQDADVDWKAAQEEYLNDRYGL